MGINITDTGHRAIEQDPWGRKKSIGILLLINGDGLGLGFLRPRYGRRGVWEFLVQTPEGDPPLTAETLPPRRVDFDSRKPSAHPIQTIVATRLTLKSNIERGIKNGTFAVTWGDNLARKATVAKRRFGEAVEEVERATVAQAEAIDELNRAEAIRDEWLRDACP